MRVLLCRRIARTYSACVIVNLVSMASKLHVHESTNGKNDRCCEGLGNNWKKTLLATSVHLVVLRGSLVFHEASVYSITSGRSNSIRFSNRSNAFDLEVGSESVPMPIKLAHVMKLWFRTRRLSRCPTMFVPMATQLAQNSRSDGLARGLLNSVPMPTKFEWLRWSIEPGSSKQSERSFFRYRRRAALQPK